MEDGDAVEDGDPKEDGDPTGDGNPGAMEISWLMVEIPRWMMEVP